MEDSRPVVSDAVARLRRMRGDDSIDEVCFGYRCVTLVDVDALADAQVGYAVGPRGEVLAGEALGDWRTNWLVVGTDDELGDPIFVDVATEEWAVYTAARGTGTWEPERIADTFSSFLRTLQVVSELAIGREDPTALERNPLSSHDRELALAEIRNRNPHSELAYWRDWLEQD